MQAYSNKEYNEPTIVNLCEIFYNVECNQVFGSAYVVKILGCSERTARNLILKLKDMEVIIALAGKGKGMYRFKYSTEV